MKQWIYPAGTAMDDFEVPLVHVGQVAEDWEAEVNQGDEGSHHPTHVRGPRVVALGDVQGGRGHHLLPAKRHVGAEDDDGGDVEEAPPEGLEELEFKTVDVPHGHRVFEMAILRPEQVEMLQVDDALKVDEVRWGTQLVRDRRAEAELEEVHAHEGKQHHSRNRQVELSEASV